MTGKRPDLDWLSPAQKDALIGDLWRQLAAAQSEVRLLKRRLGMAEQQAGRLADTLRDRLREADPRPPAEPPAALSVSSAVG